MKASLLGIPQDLGGENLGVDIGPNAFRYQQIIKKLQSIDLDVKDIGNITCRERHALSSRDMRLKYLEEILVVSEDAAKVVYEEVKKENKVIALGGDHSITLGLFAGAAAAVDGKLGLIYFDAHGDMNTDETTLTGNIHGMHLASLMGFGSKALVNVYKEGAKLQTENLLHIGGSDFDDAELELVEREHLETYMIHDILADGMGPLCDKIDALQTRVENIWISIDLDSIDSIYAPGAGMPTPGGLTYREVATLASYIGKKCNVIGVDMVEYNPLNDIENKTAELGIELIAKFLGKNYSWYSNYLAKNELK